MYLCTRYYLTTIIMKKIYSIFAFVLLTTCIFSLTSCSSDDEDGLSTSDVVGTWMTTSIESSDGKWVDLTNKLYARLRAYATFNSDGTYVGWGSLGNGTGTWKIKGNKVTTYVDGEVFIIYSDIVLEGDVMSGKMSQGESSLNFKAQKQ